MLSTQARSLLVWLLNPRESLVKDVLYKSSESQLMLSAVSCCLHCRRGLAVPPAVATLVRPRKHHQHQVLNRADGVGFGGWEMASDPNIADTASYFPLHPWRQALQRMQKTKKKRSWSSGPNRRNCWLTPRWTGPIREKSGCQAPTSDKHTFFFWIN